MLLEFHSFYLDLFIYSCVKREVNILYKKIYTKRNINLQATKFRDLGVFKYPCPDTNDVDSIDIAKNDHDRVVVVVVEVVALLLLQQFIFVERRRR